MNWQQDYAGASSGSVALGIPQPTAPASFEDYSPREPAPFDISSLQLPGPNMQCYQEPPAPKGEVKFFQVIEPEVKKSVTLNFNTCRVVTKENTIHHQHIKNVIINVNRNHWHTQRVVLKDNHYHHHLINNIIKVTDIHHQKIEQVRGESKNFTDYKQTQLVEPATCLKEGQSIVQEAPTAVAPAPVVNVVSSSDYTKTYYNCPEQAQQQSYNY